MKSQADRNPASEEPEDDGPPRSRVAGRRKKWSPPSVADWSLGDLTREGINGGGDRLYQGS